MAGGSRRRVLPPKRPLLLVGRQWLEKWGGVATAVHPLLNPPQLQLLGQFADDSDEGAIFIFQPLVVGFQFR